MWYSLTNYDYVLVTTNSFIKKDGDLVMGRGAAKEAAGKFPGLARAAGNYVRDVCGHLGTYHCEPQIMYAHDTYTTLGIFQVKKHFKDDADLGLIKESADSLNKLFRDSPHLKVALNFPGIGNGNLKREEVIWTLEELPDNIDIWEY